MKYDRYQDTELERTAWRTGAELREHARKVHQHTLDFSAERQAYLRQKAGRAAMRGIVFGVGGSLLIFWAPLLWLVSKGLGWWYLPYVGVIVGLGVLWARRSNR